MKKKHQGFTLIEVLIDTFIITLVFGALAASFLLVLNTVNAGKVRTAAASLANEQMESLRNLPYDSLDTLQSPNVQTLTRSGVSYTVSTSIITVDDPFDGCIIPSGGGLYSCTDGGTSATQDLIPVDYKRMSIVVTQQNKGLILAQLSSNAAAKAAETATNTGILLVIVNNAIGLPVEGAFVTLTNTDNGVSIQGYTNALGYLLVASLPPDTQNRYHIVATKNGYSTDFTTPRTSQNPNQFQPDVSISVQQITTQTMFIDWLATVSVNVTNEQNQPVANAQLTLTSSKITQINPDTPKHVYTATTDIGGIANFTDIEWDSYSLSAPAGYNVVVTSPYQKVSIPPSLATTINLVVTTVNNWPQLTTVSPTSGSTLTPVLVTFEGDHFAQQTTIVLRKTGQPDIPTTGPVDVNNNEKEMTATFNLAGAATGSWDIVITSNGNIITQIAGFSIS